LSWIFRSSNAWHRMQPAGLPTTRPDWARRFPSKPISTASAPSSRASRRNSPTAARTYEALRGLLRRSNQPPTAICGVDARFLMSPPSVCLESTFAEPAKAHLFAARPPFPLGIRAVFRPAPVAAESSPCSSTSVLRVAPVPLCAFRGARLVAGLVPPHSREMRDRIDWRVRCARF